MNTIGDIGFRGFKKINPASTGSIVNPLNGLTSAVGSIADRYMRQKEEEENQRRWEEQNRRAEEAMQIKRDALKREDAKRKFLQEYDPRVGELGGRGVDKNALRGYSDVAGKDITKLLSEYGVGEDKSVVDLMKEDPSKHSELSDRLKSLGSTSLNQLRGLGTKEDVERLVMQDIQENTGDPVLASKLAENYGNKYIGREELQKAEKQKVDEYNKNIERLAKQAKYLAKARGTSNGSSSNKMGIKNTYIDRDTRNKQIDELDLGWSDKGEAIEFVDDAIKEGVSPSVAMLALKDSVDRGWFDDTVGKSKAEFLEHADKLQSMVSSSSGKKGAINHTPEELAQILARPVQSSDYSTIQRLRGEKAYDTSFGRNIRESNDAQKSVQPDVTVLPATRSRNIPSESDLTEVNAVLKALEETPKVDIQKNVEQSVNKKLNSERDLMNALGAQGVKPMPNFEEFAKSVDNLVNNVMNVEKDTTKNLVKNAIIEVADDIPSYTAEDSYNWLRFHTRMGNLNLSDTENILKNPEVLGRLRDIQKGGLSLDLVLPEQTLSTVTPVLDLLAVGSLMKGAKATKGILKRKPNARTPLDNARDIAAEEARVANRMNALKGKKAFKPSDNQSIDLSLPPSSKALDVRKRLLEEEKLRNPNLEAVRLQEWLRNRP